MLTALACPLSATHSCMSLLYVTFYVGHTSMCLLLPAALADMQPQQLLESLICANINMVDVSDRQHLGMNE
jgi:hypothetical protein